MHLFSLLANESTEQINFFGYVLGLKTSCVLSCLGDTMPAVLLHITAGCSSSMHCRSCHPSSAVLLSTWQTNKWFAYMQLHISSLYFSLPLSAWCKLNKIFLPQHCGFMSISGTFLHLWDGWHWLTAIPRMTRSTLLILFILFQQLNSMSSYTIDEVWAPILRKLLITCGTFLLATMPVRRNHNHLANFHCYSFDLSSNWTAINLKQSKLISSRWLWLWYSFLHGLVW